MKKIFFKVFLLIGIVGLILLFDISNSRAAVTVDYGTEFYAGSDFYITITSSDLTNDYQLWSGNKCILLALDNNEYIWYQDYFSVQTLWPESFPNTTQQATTTNTFHFTNAYPGLWTNAKIWLKQMTGADCGDEDLQDYDIELHTSCYVSLDDIVCSGYHISSMPKPTSTAAAATTTTSTIQLIENPLQNIFNGLILFFIMLFGFIFYFKK